MTLRTVGLITYHHPHLKTEQVLQKLLTRGLDYRMYALPFIERKGRPTLFSHRPYPYGGSHPEIMAAAHNIPYERVESDSRIPAGCDVYVILGAGLLSKECIQGKRIINGHPGIIPASRGLDSFKWSILDQKPLGVTLHFVDDQVDAGEIISIVPTPVYSDDTLESLARRHYELEIDCMGRFDDFLRSPVNPFVGIAAGEPRMRMPQEKERELADAFSAYVRRHSKSADPAGADPSRPKKYGNEKSPRV